MAFAPITEGAVAGRARSLVALVLAVSLTGCSAPYLLRAACEELRILARRQPIERVLAGEVDTETRAKLELTLAVRAFARERLGLRVGGSYTSLARVDADQVVHLVSAARRDRLVPYTWWFPLVGRVPYRGYFDPAHAQALAAKLEADGYDTYVRPAVAFSTLGWLDDPLLSNLLRYDQVELANIIIHELLHSTIYMAGEARFNESFASFVGAAGTVAFFAGRADERRAELARVRWADEVTFSRFLARLMARLEDAYTRGVDLAQREALFDAARRAFRNEEWRTDRYQDFPNRTLNNAILLHDQLYAHRLELFDDVYRRYGQDLRTAIRWVRATVANAEEPFGALERALGSVNSRQLTVGSADGPRPWFRTVSRPTGDGGPARYSSIASSHLSP